MRSHKIGGRTLTGPSALTPAEDDRMRELFVGAFADCPRQPDVVYQTAHGVRAPWRRLMDYFCDGLARGAWPAKVARFFDGARLILLARVCPARRSVSELLRLEAETDAAADRAEMDYALDPRSEGNLSRLIETTLASVRVKEELVLALAQSHEPPRLRLVAGGSR